MNSKPNANSIGLLVIIVLAPVLIFLIPLYHVIFKQPKNRFCIPLYFFGAVFSFFWGINIAVFDGQNYLEYNVFSLKFTDENNQQYQIERLYYKDGKPMDLQLGIKTTVNKYINEAKKEFYEFLLD